jgi:dihydrofolate synthase/folylpolyglutamate synthase
MGNADRYHQVIEEMYGMLPMFSKIGGAAYKPSLENIAFLSAAIGHPHQQLKCIHVAGTNGKGSVSHWLASVLQEAGYSTGLYTSPHLKDFRERIRVNGQMISEEEVVSWYDRLLPAAEECQASFFEMTVAMAFGCFAEREVDFAIIETGMGGRLDSTNIIDPILSVITNIGLDHQQFLGNTLPEIASEKAGIIKPRKPVLIGKYQAGVKDVFLNMATRMEAPLLYAEDFVASVEWMENARCKVTYVDGKTLNFVSPMSADYQRENIRTVVASLEWLNQMYFSTNLLSAEVIQKGLERVIGNTGIRGRWQILRSIPKVIADVGHNMDGIREVVHQLKKEDYDQLHIVYGAVKDKDVEGILRLLPAEAQFYFCEPPLPRKLPAFELAAIATATEITHFFVIPDPATAYKTALYQTGDNDLLLILGSFFVVGEII